MRTGKILLAFLIGISAIKAFAQGSDMDSLRRILATTKNSKQKIDALIKLSDDYSNSKVDSSLYYANALHDFAVKIKDRSAEGYALGNIGYYYMHQGNLVRSLQLALAALQIFEQIKDSVNIANGYNGLGHIYWQEKDLGNAWKYYTMERTLAAKINDYRDEAYGCLNLSMVFKAEHQIDSAIFYGERSLKLYDEHQIYYGKTGALVRLAEIYDAAGRHSLAKDTYWKAIATANKIHDQTIYDTELKYAIQLYKWRQVDSALVYANKISANQDKIILSGKASLYELLSSIYGDKKQYKEAFEFKTKATALNDSLTNTEQTQQTANLLFNEQQRQIDIKNAAAAYRERFNARLRLYAMIGAATVLLFIGIGLWRRNLRQKRTNLLLSEQKEEISAQRDRLSETLDELKTTQKQLIQSEKMASLGELSAGIAHEIQNPLNFVNNFSEVNTELIDEMEQEIDRGDLAEIKAIARDIRENEKKINMHGKRADAIVKGMLQHSQSSNLVKEPTNINAVAEECMRLAYHGLRAKDKDFNSEMIVNLDESLPKVNVVPQDIGRVFLNLFNNAFYAVNLKKKTAGPDYKPTVELTTFSPPSGGPGAVISVKDNGIGIPDAIKDKIMQPFFTTKPTGEGTGLGLSLAYDMVVKGHGGKIEVNSKEGEFTEFIITLPL